MLPLVVAVRLHYLGFYAAAGEGISFLFRCVSLVVAAAAILLLIWLRRRASA